MPNDQNTTGPDTGTDKGDTPDLASLMEERDKWKALARKHEEQARANADAARELAEIKDQTKTETERLAERLQASETAAAQAQAEALRYRVGLAHGIPLEFIPRLQGATEEDLTADAVQFAKSLTPAKSDPITTKPLATLSLGATPQDEQTPEDPNEAIRRLLSSR